MVLNIFFFVSVKNKFPSNDSYENLVLDTKHHVKPSSGIKT